MCRPNPLSSWNGLQITNTPVPQPPLLQHRIDNLERIHIPSITISLLKTGTNFLANFFSDYR